MILADKSSILDSLLGKILNIGLGADNADVVGVAVMALIRQSNMLADEHSNTDTGHIETVEERLD